jgi:hypothetical protein
MDIITGMVARAATAIFSQRSSRPHRDAAVVAVAMMKADEAGSAEGEGALLCQLREIFGDVMKRKTKSKSDARRLGSVDIHRRASNAPTR